MNLHSPTLFIIQPNQTSLMARDLLTPDEVKQLHYKTIIFPIIGYPIFRDTVMYISFLVMKKVRLKEKLIH